MRGYQLKAVGERKWQTTTQLFLVFPLALFLTAGINQGCRAQAASSEGSTAKDSAPPALHWKCSTPSSPWVDMPDVAMNPTIPVPGSPYSLVLVNSTERKQVIDGWGGCFNERGWKAMECLPTDERQELLRKLFAPEGLNLNLCRTPIGASDYATALYSLDEQPGDYSMENFSIARDRQRLIPYIKAALAIRPDLKLWAVPWSPPSWMKSNDNLVGGDIKDDDKTLDALALYFVRYLQAYKAEGIGIGMVMPQNEPNIASDYTSCLWTGEELAKFIGYHLGPRLKREGLDTSIFLGTLNDSSRGGYAYWVGPSMQDAAVRPYLSGVGCQWSGDTTMAETHFLFPSLKLMQSEAECGKPNTNDWAFGEKQYGLAKKWFEAGAGSNIIWNLVLDESGLSTGGWAQCSPVVVDTRTRKVTYTPYYYCYKHFSWFVQPGAHIIATESTWGDRVAFANPNGDVIVVMANVNDEAKPIAVAVDGRQSAIVNLPAHSFNTFSYPSPDGIAHP
jgi:glucosylceramidase